MTILLVRRVRKITLTKEIKEIEIKKKKIIIEMFRVARKNSFKI